MTDASVVEEMRAELRAIHGDLREMSTLLRTSLEEMGRMRQDIEGLRTSAAAMQVAIDAKIDALRERVTRVEAVGGTLKWMIGAGGLVGGGIAGGGGYLLSTVVGGG